MICPGNGDTVPLDGNISAGCEPPTCSFFFHEGDPFPCHYDQQHLINNDSLVDTSRMEEMYAVCCRCNGDTVTEAIWRGATVVGFGLFRDQAVLRDYCSFSEIV